ncbi:unnamed protein product, partial [Pylaiella littoralis]
MHTFFASGKGATHRRDYLRVNGGELSMESDICNACWLFFRNNGGSVKTTAAAYASYVESSSPGGGESANAERCVALELLEHLRSGKMVSLHECMSWVHAERERVGLRAAGERHLTRIAHDIFKDLADNVEGTTAARFSGSELVDLFNADGRRSYVYLAPTVLDLAYVVQIDLNLKHLEELEKDRRQSAERHVDGAGDASGGVTSAQTKDLEVVKRAGIIVHDAIVKSPLNLGTRSSIATQLDTNIPDALEYIREDFPPEFSTLLAYCSGKEYLVSEAATNQQEPSGSEETGVAGNTEGQSTDAVMVYFWGTAIIKAVLGSRYIPPHYLKLSQVFKVSGVGAWASSLLSRIGLMCSDSQRWTAEDRRAKTTRDKDLITCDARVPVSVAWDNCDTDATAKYESAVHNGQIAATVNVLRVKAGGSVSLSPAESWRPATQVTFEEIQEGLPLDDHEKTITDFGNLLLEAVARSRSQGRMEGGEQTCVEAELRKLMTAIDVEVDSQLTFVMAGLTKRDGDCEDALNRVARVVHAGTYGERVLVVVEGDEETHSFMVNLKRSQPTKYEWLLPVPGAWHLLLHASKALI